MSGKSTAKPRGERLEVETIHLTAEESRAFAKALLDPREPSARLKEAAQRYPKLVGD